MWPAACLYAQIRFMSYLFPEIGFEWYDSRCEEIQLVIEKMERAVMVTDPIADMLTRIRNAILTHHDSVQMPLSKAKLAVAKILKDEGFIIDYSVLKDGSRKVIKIVLKYIDNKPAILGIERVSNPGLRIYVGRGEIPRVYGGLGIAILSTSKGLMVGHDAHRQNIGGGVCVFFL